MDSSFTKYIGDYIESAILTLIVWSFIAGIVLVLIVGGLIWGGHYLYKNYSIVKTEQTTNTVTVTNMVWQQK